MRKRFLAPLCVFIFGMAAVLSSSSVPRWGHGLSGAAARSGGRCALVGPSGLRTGVLLFADLFGDLFCDRGLVEGGVVQPVTLDVTVLDASLPQLGLGVGLLLVRADHHDHVSAVLLWVALDEAEIGDVRRH